MEHIPTIINTIILILIFFYQKNKNKILTDRISEQSVLLKETKDVVTQQAQAINSQKTVVDTAIEYTKSFDISKIENLVKREVEIEYKQLLKQLEEQYEDKITNIKQNHKAIISNNMENVAVYSAKLIANEYITPLVAALLRLLLLKGEAERKSVLKDIPQDISKHINNGLKEFDKVKPKGLLDTDIF